MLPGRYRRPCISFHAAGTYREISLLGKLPHFHMCYPQSMAPATFTSKATAVSVAFVPKQPGQRRPAEVHRGPSCGFNFLVRFINVSQTSATHGPLDKPRNTLVVGQYFQDWFCKRTQGVKKLALSAKEGVAAQGLKQSHGICTSRRQGPGLTFKLPKDEPLWLKARRLEHGRPATPNQRKKQVTNINHLTSLLQLFRVYCMSIHPSKDPHVHMQIHLYLDLYLYLYVYLYLYLYVYIWMPAGASPDRALFWSCAEDAFRPSRPCSGRVAVHLRLLRVHRRPIPEGGPLI